MDDLEQRLHEAACGTGDGDMADLLREAAAALEAFRDGTTSQVRILIDAIESEIRQLEGTAAWKSQAARIASLRAAIDAARKEARND